jgi:cell pole-organizing protein PopZ
MEEILASIRRIIADDDAGKTKAPEAARARAPAPPPPAAKPAPPPPPPPVVKAEPPPPPPPPPPPEPVPDVLELTPDMEVQPAAPSFRKIEPSGDLTFDEPPPPPPAPAPLPEPPSTIEVARRQFQSDTGADRLLSAQTSAAVDAAFNSLAQTVLVQGSLTLEDMPNLVERLVRAEIERVARGRG